MKDGYSILTRKIQGMDVNVWITFIVVVIVSAATLAYKVASPGTIKKADIAIVDATGSSKNSFYINNPLTFITGVKGRVLWDFGDGFEAKGTHVMHTYADSGKKVVTIFMNGKAANKDTIVVKGIYSTNAEQPELHPIAGPDQAKVNVPVTFAYAGTRNVTAVEWTVLDLPVYGSQRTRMGKFKFFAEGTLTIQLQLNHDKDQTYTKTVVVLPSDDNTVAGHGGSHKKKGGESMAATPKVDTPHKQAPVVVTTVAPKVAPPSPHQDFNPNFTDEELLAMFKEVVRGTRTAKDFAPYLCNGTGDGTRVVANGEVTTVESFCQKVQKSNVKIKEVSVVRDYKHCITAIAIKYHKLILGIG